MNYESQVVLIGLHLHLHPSFWSKTAAQALTFQLRRCVWQPGGFFAPDLCGRGSFEVAELLFGHPLGGECEAGRNEGPHLGSKAETSRLDWQTETFFFPYKSCT